MNRLIPHSIQLKRRMTNLSFELDRETEILWCNQRHRERPSFTPRLLRDVQAFQQRVKARHAGIDAPAFRYLVWASARPEVFNLGGDLDLIYQLVTRQDRAGLLRYVRACIDICHQNANKLDLPIVTVALCQGETLGGGFEAALSSDVIIAEDKGAVWLERWVGFARQFGGLAKVDRLGVYAASFSVVSVVGSIT
ncbi:MAG: hypothetical protein EXQ98_07275 [Alphaproteobacteria bacterium]|nr:hypothetical protein [Alphaproteobacteria bacterium]